MAMKATDFEYRHQTLMHLLIVAVSFLTYLTDRDDVVWALVREQSHPRLLERLFFALATLLIGIATALRTWARAYPESSVPGNGPPVLRDGPYGYLRYPQELGNLLFAIGLGFLAPLSGFVVLVAGEAILVFRLIQRETERKTYAEDAGPNVTQPLPHRSLLELPMWGKAFRQESAKWGLFLTMIVFTLLLRDQVAEVLAVASFLVWAVLNCGSLHNNFTSTI
jgi:protein-S-isoprenylcysteine O-methyltransferase Ste14